MVDYSELQTIAQELVTEFGGNFTFRSFAVAPGAPAKPWDGPTDPRAGTATTSVQKAVVVEPRDMERLGFSVETDDLLKRSDMILIVAGSSVDLSTFEEVDGIGGTFKITKVSRLIPNGSTNLLWFVGLKR